MGLLNSDMKYQGQPLDHFSKIHELKTSSVRWTEVHSDNRTFGLQKVFTKDRGCFKTLALPKWLSQFCCQGGGPFAVPPPIGDRCA